MAQVAGKSGRGPRGVGACRCAENQRQPRADDQDDTVFPNLTHVMRINAAVDQKRHHRREDNLHHDLKHDKKRREQRIFFELTHAFQQSFDHSVSSEDLHWEFSRLARIMPHTRNQVSRSSSLMPARISASVARSLSLIRASSAKA